MPGVSDMAEVESGWLEEGKGCFAKHGEVGRYFRNFGWMNSAFIEVGGNIEKIGVGQV